MRGRFKTMLATIFTITILLNISGLAAADWHYGYDIYDEQDVTSEQDILGAPNGYHCTIGGSPAAPGWIIVDMGDYPIVDVYGIDIHVNHTSAVAEYYEVWVITSDFRTVNYVGDGIDTANETFDIGNSDFTEYKYVKFVADSWSTGPGDMIPGPEVDALGWYEPPPP